MISEASYERRYDESFPDACRHSVKKENVQYTPNDKRKLGHSAASVERCSKYQKTHKHKSDVQGTQLIQGQKHVVGSIMQVPSEEKLLEEHHPKCLPDKLPVCNSAVSVPSDTGFFAEDDAAVWVENFTTVGVQPQLKSYQLIGDSLLLRFAEQILYQDAEIVEGVRCIGLCASGQKTADLLQKLEQEVYPVAEKIVLLIGTNDILKKTEESEMWQTMWSLLERLRRKARRIVLLTLPPIPKIQFRSDHWEKIESFNKFLRSLEDDVIMVADISQLYITEPKACKMEFFEKYYHNGVREDLIHLNKLGLAEIYTYLTDNNYLEHLQRLTGPRTGHTNPQHCVTYHKT